jgi:hypothetical protein
MKLTFLISAVLLSASTLLAGKPDHSAWDAILKKYVNSSGKVNYAGLKKDEAKVDAYIKDIQTNLVESSWSTNEKKAYWINAYNAHTIHLILSKYPLKSINDLSFSGKSAFDYKFIDLGAAKMSLNELETNKIRKAFNDPRIHFAVNCASFSCPLLINKAFTAENVESLLTEQTKKFLADKTRNKISGSKAEISKIFDWYKEDFGNVTEFINKYSTTKITSKTAISYLEYDWSLNKQ